MSVATIESAFTADWPDADCYREVASMSGDPATGKPFCSCAPGACAKATEPDLMDLDAIEFPVDATEEQRDRVRTLARSFRAVLVEVGPWVGLGAPTPAPCPLCASTLPTELVVQRKIECPAHKIEPWLYLVVHPLHGGEFHCGIEPDGSSHS